MSSPTITAVLLAAGKGTRMKSGKAKVLHELFFKPMLHHVLDSVAAAEINTTAIIVGHQRERVLDTLSRYTFTPVYQEEQLGTGHAVLCAEKACASSDLVMILCGDTPLIRPATLNAMINQHKRSNALLTLMTTRLDNPFGYGRIITNDAGYVSSIVEQKDADNTQRAINEINAGIYLVDTGFLFTALKQVGTDNSQGEVYLTDIVAIAADQGHKVHKFMHETAIDVLGVNSRIELARAHQELQMRHNQEIMLSGVSMYSPETTLIAPECSIGQDCVLEAGVQVINKTTIATGVHLASGVLLDNCSLGEKCRIGANSVLRGCTVPDNTEIPPLTCKQE
ncbi:MAG: glycosyl transferase family 2 [Desulfobulbus sp.]|nr:MAG: glycosyl transferase family 2 [Desulfobulbus sp.]